MFEQLLPAEPKPRRSYGKLPAGLTFGRLTTTAETKMWGPKHDQRRKRLCKCSCGKEHWVRDDHLINGVCNSCGCLRQDTARARLAELRKEVKPYGHYAPRNAKGQLLSKKHSLAETSCCFGKVT